LVQDAKQIARYKSVALSIAEQIVKGTYLPGTRIHGRSTLSSLYQVSPETIRKATALLEQQGIVEAKHGSGIHVLSAERAADYLQANNERRDAERIIDQIHGLMQEQQKNMEQMNSLLRELLAASRRN
jgi:DNA-binding GntR family transcriptional regulator